MPASKPFRNQRTRFHNYSPPYGDKAVYDRISPSEGVRPRGGFPSRRNGRLVDFWDPREYAAIILFETAPGIDRCTRMIVGFHLHVEPPSSITIAAALRNAFAPKLYMRTRWPDVRPNVAWGLPELLILDNGLENHATFLLEALEALEALEELGVAWLFAKKRTPEDKPYIERWFGTLTRDFSSRLPGWVGSNPREKGDYDSAAMACLRIEDADELLHRWVANYNVDVHEGITDVPEAKWRRLVEDHEVAPIEDMGILDVLLGDYALRTPACAGFSCSASDTATSATTARWS